MAERRAVLRCDVQLAGAVMCNWQQDAGIVSVGPAIWKFVTAKEHEHHKAYVVTRPDSIPEGQTRWREHAQGFGEFKSIPRSNTLGKYLEVGAGLFTQLYNVLKYKTQGSCRWGRPSGSLSPPRSTNITRHTW
eukprot:TRINITY_DN3965_c0_g1_i2.p1 TRINITY_DN3965_c0_g1~~TRINITY_DN3965_c0_g1_i2.p1  ORF type:complete len:133 (-),score=20.11 TRINITY_DN3965_c0_g1_i2:178-576(-)